MRRLALLLLPFLALVTNEGAHASTFSFNGYADFRLVLPPSEKSWLDGGLGKLRYGASQPDPDFRFAEAVGQLTFAWTDELHFVAVARVEPQTPSGIDALEGYAAWRPQPFGDWGWSMKAGAFFPTISVENDDLGWTSPYTLTPSAINSWIGEELRTIGGEGTLSRQTSWGTVSAIGAVFCCNEPAGTMMADRGWAMDDRPTGLFEPLRLPDATVSLFGGTPPGHTKLFQNIDDRAGWYAGLKWDVPDLGQIAVLRYDNNADPFASNAYDSSWLTRFWSASLKTRIAGVTVLAQALTGDTAIGGGGMLFTTRFNSAFVLASYDIGEDWRVSARAETFDVRDHPSFTLIDEDGHAFTAAAIWTPKDWLRVTAEIIAITSRRGERTLEALNPTLSNTQFQLSTRFIL
jgi:hypothetical protein